METHRPANFCIAPNGIHNDLEITLIALTPPRPGFDAIYKIIYKNKGTVAQDGSVIVEFQDDIMDLVSTSFPNVPYLPNQLKWNFTGLQPFESREFTFTMNINSPVETPAVNVGKPPLLLRLYCYSSC